MYELYGTIFLLKKNGVSISKSYEPSRKNNLFFKKVYLYYFNQVNQ